MNGINEIRRANLDVERYLYREPGAAEEVSVFIPRRFELSQIVEFWYRQGLREQWDFFLCQDFIDCDAVLEYFAKARIDRIDRVLGNDEIKNVIAQVQAEFARSYDPEHWHIFLNGDEAQKRAVREKVCGNPE